MKYIVAIITALSLTACANLPAPPANHEFTFAAPGKTQEKLDSDAFMCSAHARESRLVNCMTKRGNVLVKTTELPWNY